MKEQSNVPLKQILDFQGNSYELTNAIIKRAAQLSHTGSEKLPSFKDKIVSLAMSEVFHQEVVYKKA